MLPKGIGSTKKFLPSFFITNGNKNTFLAAPKRVVQLEDETDNAINIFCIRCTHRIGDYSHIYNTKDGNRLHPLFRERTFMTQHYITKVDKVMFIDN